MTGRIEDYAMIGDCETAALVSRDGSVDWLCWPRFDSGACFAALVGSHEHGHWSIRPFARDARIERRYREHTLILETDFETDGGAVTVVDFMPIRGSASDLVRIVIGRRGRVSLRSQLSLRFDYGSAAPWITRDGDGALRAVAGPDMAVLRSNVQFEPVRHTMVGEFSVSAGERATFVLTYVPSHRAPPAAIDPEQALVDTERFWRQWVSRCSYRGAAQDAVVRSLITLKALTYAPTGGVVAAATSSLPERIGGRRNWDYRYCWLRDATLTLLALMDAGYTDEARAFRDWLLRATAGAPSQLQIMYGVGGERRIPEIHLDWLPGYEASVPVRTGNAAAGQRQLDVYGEIMDVLHQARCGGLVPSDAGWTLQRALVDHLEAIWSEPDHGIWEVRGERQHFTHSKLMVWVALDRTIRSAERFRLDGPLASWRALRSHVHAQICAQGYDPSRRAFVQAYGSTELDASLLLIPLVGFLPPTDPRVRGTVAAIERDLVTEGFVLRYDTERTRDGLPPGEGAFVPCSFWLADNWLLQGREAEARALFERLLSIRNDVGLLAEEYDVEARRQLGNVPQAFSHLALVVTALNLARDSKPVEQRGGGS